VGHAEKSIENKTKIVNKIFVAGGDLKVMLL